MRHQTPEHRHNLSLATRGEKHYQAKVTNEQVLKIYQFKGQLGAADVSEECTDGLLSLMLDDDILDREPADVPTTAAPRESRVRGHRWKVTKAGVVLASATSEAEAQRFANYIGGEVTR